MLRQNLAWVGETFGLNFALGDYGRKTLVFFRG